MATKQYQTINGSVVAESIEMQRTSYLTDALPSVTSVHSSQLGHRMAARYSPFGVRTTNPIDALFSRFNWSGSVQSSTTQRMYIDNYNLSRHYSSYLGCWVTKDSLWPDLAPYNYAGNNPVTFTDKTGASTTCPPRTQRIIQYLIAEHEILDDFKAFAYCNNCVRREYCLCTVIARADIDLSVDVTSTSPGGIFDRLYGTPCSFTKRWSTTIKRTLTNDCLPGLTCELPLNGCTEVNSVASLFVPPKDYPFRSPVPLPPPLHGSTPVTITLSGRGNFTAAIKTAAKGCKVRPCQ